MAAGETPTRRRGDWVASLCILLASISFKESNGFLVGNTRTCEEEGAVIELPFIVGNPCITCMCSNHIVKCQKKACENMDNCALVVKALGRDCCEHCKVCLLNGDVYLSGQRWTMDECQHFQCQEGVVTSSTVQCEPQCEHPNIGEGSCCPVCPGCILNGVLLEEGETSYKEDDPCLECSCQDGSLSCSRRTCPVLSCPSYQVQTPAGECCPKCMAQRRVFELGDRCLFGGEVFEDGNVVFEDDCTACICLSATVICDTEQCPAQYDCHQRHLVKDEGACCPRCAGCTVNGTMYQHDEEWSVSPCGTCRCDGGHVQCNLNTCENAPQVCPDSLREIVQTPEGECCPRCVERNGTCTVYGDPHYRTFDGRLFNFQGRCKYLLTADCVDSSFRIRVRNDGRESRYASWSKTVFIHVGGNMITLRQGRKVRVNRIDVAVPHTEPLLGHIENEDHVITVYLNIGIKVLWNGDSFIEVTASTSYKGKLCGLCGNYDADRRNDFRTFKGAVVTDVNVFASSWRIGSKEECDASEKKKSFTPCRNNPFAKVQARKECKILKSAQFDSCKGVVDQYVYYRSCMTDVCECGPTHACACEAILAFMRECERHGIDLRDVYSGNCIL